MKSTVAAECAKRTGWRNAPNITAVPILTRLVLVAIAASTDKGSSLGLAVKLSPTHTESKLAFSTVSAISTSELMLDGWGLVNRSNLVGSRTPNFNQRLSL